jgi:hypothetical protein
MGGGHVAMPSSQGILLFCITFLCKKKGEGDGRNKEIMD